MIKQMVLSCSLRQITAQNFVCVHVCRFLLVRLLILAKSYANTLNVLESGGRTYGKWMMSCAITLMLQHGRYVYFKKDHNYC